MTNAAITAKATNERPAIEKPKPGPPIANPTAAGTIKASKIIGGCQDFIERRYPSVQIGLTSNV